MEKHSLDECLPVVAHADGATVTVVQRAQQYAGESRAANTRRAYKADWRDFESWCMERSRGAIPASSETVALYITSLADHGLRVSTIERRLATISQAHQLAGHGSPTKDAAVREVLKGIRRVRGCAPSRKKAISVAELRGLVATCDASPKGRRDRALLLVGFLGGFRRSELVALERDDIQIEDEGLRIRIRKSKTDQDSEGREVGVPVGNRAETCPVLALTAWLQTAGSSEGPVFQSLYRGGRPTGRGLSGNAVACLIKERAMQAGLDPELLSGHSLRSGFCTSAAKAGASEREIARSTGHRSLRILRTYIQAGTVFSENAAKRIQL
ncbi:MAG: site-specific integrase [Sumerlaeia bacterium]